MKYSILGCGFIGTNLLINLLQNAKEGDKIQVVDRSLKNVDAFYPFYSEAQKRGVIVHLYHYEGRDFLKENNTLVLDFFEDSIVFNLMAIVGVKNWSQDQFNSYQKNKEINDLIIPYLPKVKKYIFASTSEVYGSGDKPFTEKSEFRLMNYDASGRGLYALEKIQGELISRNAKSFVNVRLFNIIGKYQEKSKGVVPLFIDKLQNDEPIKCSRDVRCFCDVRDCVNSMMVLAHNNFCGNINICNPENTLSMFELGEMLQEFLKSRSPIETYETDGISLRKGDNTLLSKFYKMKYNILDTFKYILEK